jgi:molybdopterin converting factor subunit 1
MSERINVTVLFFGAARDAAGVGEVTVETAAPASVRTVKETIFSTYKPVSRFAASLMIAVNEEYATDDTEVQDHDIVALLPPVSGG